MLHVPLRRLLLPLVLAGLTAACLRVPPELPGDATGMPGAPSTAAELLGRHVKALGGDAAVRAIGQRTVEARMLFKPEEGCDESDDQCMTEEQTGSFVLKTTSDGRLYRRTVIGSLVEERGFDGKVGWQMRNGRLLVEDGGELEMTREDALLHWYFDLDKRGVEASLVKSRDRDHDDNPVVLDGLRWELPKTDIPPKTLWFERTTGLLREETINEEGPEGFRQTIVYEDYRPVDGVLVPFRIRVFNEYGDRAQEVVFSTQGTNHGKFDGGVFALPEVPEPERTKDPRLTLLEDARAEAKSKPKDSSAAVRLARAAWAAAHFDEAADAARATLALAPKEPEAIWILARAHVLSGDLRAAEKLFARARRAGVKKQAIARQHAWIHNQRRNFARLAKALDKAGNPVLAGRYRSFAGKPLQLHMAGNGCSTTVDLISAEPVTILDVMIGKQKVRAMLDTGAGDIIIADKLADELGVAIQARTGPEQGPQIQHGQLGELTIGEAQLKNVPVDVFQAEAIQNMAGEDHGDVQAVVGMRPLHGFQVTLDGPKKKLELVARGGKCRAQLAARRTGAAVRFWLHETHYMYVMARLNGAEGLYLVNTGMRGAALTATSLAFGHAGVGAPPVKRGEVSMVDVAKLALHKDVKIEKVKAAWGFFEQTESSDGFRIDGMFGLELLGKRRFTVDFDERKLYFAPPS